MKALEQQRRIDFALRELGLMRPRHQVVASLAEVEGISIRSARRYVERAEAALVASIGESDRTALLAQLISTLQDTTRRAVATERFSDVIGCCRLIGQLTGLLERGGNS